jgi:hypothetical protein
MGKIELDHTGAGSGITLSSDGTDLLLNGTAVGGVALPLSCMLRTRLALLLLLLLALMLWRLVVDQFLLQQIQLL